MQNTEKEDRALLARIEDIMRRCEENGIICYSDFLDDRMQGIAENRIKYSGIKYFFDGGYDNAERRRLVFLPDWAEKEDYFSDEPSEIVRVKYKSGGRELSHRDFLGSILGLGISRAKTGDIIVYGGGADIIIDKSLEEFLSANFFKAGRSELSLEFMPLSQLNLSEVKTQIINDTLASLRLDAFLASAYRCSRGKASEAVRQGIVFLNHAECTKPDAELKEGDVVSVKGKGKCVLEKVGGTSKKDRTFVCIKKYI